MAESLKPLTSIDAASLQQLARQLKLWGQELGFAQIGISDIDLSVEEPKLQAWLDQGYHGEMSYMANHGMMRARPTSYTLAPKESFVCAWIIYRPMPCLLPTFAILI